MIFSLSLLHENITQTDVNDAEQHFVLKDQATVQEGGLGWMSATVHDS